MSGVVYPHYIGNVKILLLYTGTVQYHYCVCIRLRSLYDIIVLLLGPRATIWYQVSLDHVGPPTFLLVPGTYL